MRLPEHVERSTIVLDGVRLVYVPIPKAASTAVLWALLELVELDAKDFLGSTKLETTRALTIHDLSIWGRRHRLEGRPDADALFAAPGWLAFTVVRDPVRRLWSAWVGKLLVHDPRFVAVYGDESWFPASPATAEDVVRAFRAFAEVLPERSADWHDPHWRSQAELAGLDELPYRLVAHAERLPADLDPVARHLHALGRDELRLRRENPSLLPFTPELLDRETWARCAAFTTRDREALGYELPKPSGETPPRVWVEAVEACLPAVHAVAERNQRIGDLRTAFRSRRAS
jgi:hypothetical protein